MKIGIRTGLVALSLTTLAACGGGGAGADLSPDPDDLIVGAVEATGSDSLSAAETFPMYYSLVIQNDTQATVQVGQGQMVVVDTDTIEFTREVGGSTTTFTASTTGQTTGSTTYTATIGGELATLTLHKGTGGTLAMLQGDTADNGFGLSGIYGFETPTGSLPPGTVVYGGGGLASAFIATDGDGEAIQLVQLTATDPELTINFGTGTVTGDLFNGTALVDLADDMTADDTLNVLVSIANGSISSGDITGQITLDADVDLGGGGGNVALTTNMTSSSVDATVFGSAGNVVGGTFEGEGSFDDGSGPTGMAIGGTFFTVESP